MEPLERFMSRQRNVRVRRTLTSNTVFADKLFNFNTLLNIHETICSSFHFELSQKCSKTNFKKYMIFLIISTVKREAVAVFSRETKWKLNNKLNKVNTWTVKTNFPYALPFPILNQQITIISFKQKFHSKVYFLVPISNILDYIIV